ncbi:hypothetical protein ACQKP0_08495 [Heyndrickxia sp. NPDC080065]
MSKFLTPEEMYMKKQRQKKLNYILIGVVVAAVFCAIPILAYHM